MSTKRVNHTPGPWAYTGGYTENGKPIADFTVYKEDQGLGYRYWDICKLGAHKSRAEQKANARLIAAAPELLEALKETLSCIDSHTDDPVVGPIIRLAQQAITKAEGRD